MFDVVIPSGNEQEFIEMAGKLGYRELVFLTDNINYAINPAIAKGRVSVRSAFMLKNPGDFGRAGKRFDYIFAPAERKFFEMKIDYVLDSEIFNKKDSMHYRRTQLNQVHAKLAKENEICIVFAFDNLFNKMTREIVLGRMMQNAVLCRKYKLKAQAFSLATKPIDMKSRAILDSLLRVLGL